MGQEAGGHEGIHVAGVGAQLQVGHVGGNLGALGIGLVADHHGIGAGEGGVADVVEFLQLHVGKHTDVHRVLHVDTGADAAGNIDLVDHVHGHVHGIQQGIDGGENGALGTDKVVDVHFVQRNFPAGLALFREGQYITAHAVLVPADTSALPDEKALGIDDAAAEQLGNHIDDAGAANAHAFLTGFTDDGQSRLHGLLVDDSRFHGAVGGTHAAADVAAFKGGTGGAGTGHEEIPVAEDKLAVGAQVDEQAHFILVPDAGSQSAGGDVAAHVGADVGGNEHRCQGVGGQLQIPGQQALPAEEAGDVRFHADRLRIHTQEQMVHGGIGAHAQPQDTSGGNAGGAAEVGDDGIQGLLQNGILELLLAPGTALLDDPVDHVRAVADLTVAGGTLCKQLAGSQVGEHHGNGGGADVDGTAHDGGILGGADLHAGEGIAPKLTLDADGKIMFPESMGQLRHNAEGHMDLLHSQLRLDGPGQTLNIGHGIIQGRLRHGHHQGAEVIDKVDAAFPELILAVLENGDLLGGRQVGGLHPALVGGGDVRHKNGAVGQHLGVAA